MFVSVTDAKAQLTDLVRRAESGDEVILTRHGHAAVRLVPVKARPDAQEKRRILENFRQSVADKVATGADAARSADHLYDDDGLPR